MKLDCVIMKDVWTINTTGLNRYIATKKKVGLCINNNTHYFVHADTIRNGGNTPFSFLFLEPPRFSDANILN